MSLFGHLKEKCSVCASRKEHFLAFGILNVICRHTRGCRGHAVYCIVHRKTATSSSANAVVNQQFLSVGHKVEGEERVKEKNIPLARGRAVY